MYSKEMRKTNKYNNRTDTLKHTLMYNFIFIYMIVFLTLDNSDVLFIKIATFS